MKRSLQDAKNELQKIDWITPWEDVEVSRIYHIAPLISLKRRDILILSKTDNEATYKRVDCEDDESGKFHRTSLFARFLLKKKSF